MVFRDSGSVLLSLFRSLEGLILSEVDNGQSKRVDRNQCVGYTFFDHEDEVSDVTLPPGLGVICGGCRRPFQTRLLPCRVSCGDLLSRRSLH
jgi:hypothetical protein